MPKAVRREKQGAILRGLQKFSGLFSYMERAVLAKIYPPNIY